MVNLRRKALSEAVGFLIILILMVAVLIPVGFLILGLPSSQVESANSAMQYKTVAQEQYQDFEADTLTSTGSPAQPIYFVYNGTGKAYIVFITDQNPPVPLQIRSILIDENGWKVFPANLNVSLGMVNSSLLGYRAIELPLPLHPTQAQDVAMVTQYGNIFYASPITVIPSVALRQPVGIAALSQSSYAVIQEPDFISAPVGTSSSSSESLSTFLKQNGGNGITFADGELIPTHGSSANYSGSWFGPICFNAQPFSTASTPTFKGKMEGQFRNANLTVDLGSFSGTMKLVQGFSFSPNGLWISNAQTDPISIINLEGYGAFNGSFNNINLTLSPPVFFFNLPTLDIQLTGSGTFYFNNVSVSLMNISGNFTGYINGMFKRVNGTNIINGIINNGTFTGKIRNANIGFAYTQNIFGYSILPGYISGTFRGSVTLPSSSTGYVILNGRFDGTISNGFLGPNGNGYSGFNGELNGNFSLSAGYGDGMFEGRITFPTPGGFLGSGLAFSSFDGNINGEFSLNNDYIQLGAYGTFNIISLSGTTTMNITSGSFFPYVSIIQPLVINASIAIANPSNETLIISSIVANIEEDATFTQSGGSTFGGTIYGSANDTLNPQILIPPLSVQYYSMKIIIPVTSIFSSGLSQQRYFNASSFFYTPGFIKLDLSLLQSNGYSVSYSTIIPPLTVPVQTNVTET
ncbi:hypothetical protein L3N51_02337 [Metallosphaera sp. J1]|uniref:hypothetical protein n=1 Tax=Metallosphaera javensis (ex Hofmann et al. 2022) TaxID=99938 RepID=UPI001EE03B00|nr:hypothetical protein [Metallosphaera javensis (ex Hofmann et al. 2022)]MCG3110040.1 hypothetical protein [Metallosphaera javensis (ex Hofmann et al. 2022)]